MIILEGKIKLVLLLLVFSLVLLPSGVNSAPPLWTVDGDVVYINDSRIYISATPHTIPESSWVTFNVISKELTGDADVILGFDSEFAKPKGLEFYKPTNTTSSTLHKLSFPLINSFTITNDSCDVGFDYNTYKRFVNYSIFFNSTEKYKTGVYCFDTYDDLGNDTYFANYTENNTVYTEWNDIKSLVSWEKIQKQYGGMNTWYILSGQTLQAGVNYTFRVYVDVTTSFDTTGSKYWFAIKPSSKTLSESIDQDLFYVLDPWFNVSFGKRKPIEVNTSINVTYYQMLYYVAYDSQMQTDFDDIRFTDSDDNSLYYWIENKTDSSNAWVWVKGNWTDLNGTQAYMYYNSTEATSLSNFTDTMYWSDESESISTVTVVNDQADVSLSLSTDRMFGSYSINITDSDISTDTGNEWIYFTSFEVPSDTNFSLIYWAKVDGISPGGAYRDVMSLYNGTSTLRLSHIVTNSSASVGTAGEYDTPNVHEWYKYHFEDLNYLATGEFKIYLNNTLTYTGSPWNSEGKIDLIKALSDPQYNGTPRLIDQAFVIKKVSPAPTYSFGTDESVALEVYDYGINDSYITFNESFRLSVNATSGVTALSTVNTSNGWQNFTLTWNDTHYIYDFNQTDLGVLDDNSTTIYIPYIILISDSLSLWNSTSLSLEYATTSLDSISATPPSQTNDAGSSVLFVADYETTESNDLPGFCSLQISAVNYTMVFDTSDLRYTLDVGGWAATSYNYDVYCINSTYQDQTSITAGTLTITSPDAGGGGGGGSTIFNLYGVNTTLPDCGNNICEGQETTLTCPSDCPVSPTDKFLKSPLLIIEAFFLIAILVWLFLKR